MELLCRKVQRTATPLVQSEQAKWKELIRAAHIKVD